MPLCYFWPNVIIRSYIVLRHASSSRSPGSMTESWSCCCWFGKEGDKSKLVTSSSDLFTNFPPAASANQYVDILISLRTFLSSPSAALSPYNQLMHFCHDCVLSAKCPWLHWHHSTKRSSWNQSAQQKSQKDNKNCFHKQNHLPEKARAYFNASSSIIWFTPTLLFAPKPFAVYGFLASF